MLRLKGHRSSLVGVEIVNISGAYVYYFCVLFPRVVITFAVKPDTSSHEPTSRNIAPVIYTITTVTTPGHERAFTADTKGTFKLWEIRRSLTGMATCVQVSENTFVLTGSSI